MSIQYDLTAVKTPRLRAFMLRLAVILLERRSIATLLTPVLTRGLGIQEFRSAEVYESPTFIPTPCANHGIQKLTKGPATFRN